MNWTTVAEGTGTVFTQSEPDRAHAEATGEVLLAIRDSQPPWLDVRRAQIDALADLPENWDSYGASPLSPDSISLAKAVLTALASVETVEEPTVTASPDGNVALCWDNGERSLDVEVRPDGFLDYSYLNESQSISDAEGSTSDLDILAFLLTQF